MFCDDVFKQIEAKKAEGDKTEFEVRKTNVESKWIFKIGVLIFVVFLYPLQNALFM